MLKKQNNKSNGIFITSSKYIIKVNSCCRKTFNKDFNELENLQTSVIGTDNFVNISIKKLKNIEDSLIKIKPGYPCDHISEENDFNSFKKLLAYFSN